MAQKIMNYYLSRSIKVSGCDSGNPVTHWVRLNVYFCDRKRYEIDIDDTSISAWEFDDFNKGSHIEHPIFVGRNRFAKLVKLLKKDSDKVIELNSFTYSKIYNRGC